MDGWTAGEIAEVLQMLETFLSRGVGEGEQRIGGGGGVRAAESPLDSPSSIASSSKCAIRPRL